MLYFPSISKWFQVERKWRPVRQQPIKKRLEKVVIGSPSDQWANWQIGWRAGWVSLPTFTSLKSFSACVTRRHRVRHAHGDWNPRRIRAAAAAATKCDQSGFLSFVQLYNEPSGDWICFQNQWSFFRRTHTHTSMLNVWSHNYCGVSEEAAASECWPKRITCHIKETHTIKMTTYQKEGWKKNEVKCWHECVHSSSGRIHSSPRQNFHKKDGRCLFWLEEFGRERVQLILLRWPKRQNLCPSLYGCHTNRPQTSSNPSKKTLYRYTSDRTFFQG